MRTLITTCVFVVCACTPIATPPEPSASRQDAARSAPLPLRTPSASGANASAGPTPGPTSTAAATAPEAPTARPVATPAPASPSAAPSGPPRMVSASATQTTATFTFDRPMKSTLACGTSGRAGAEYGAIDSGQVGEAGGQYHSNDPILEQTLQSATRASVSDDCTSVTMTFGIAAAAGTFVVRTSTVMDRDGQLISASANSATVKIADEGAPRLARVDGIGDNLYLRFSEPMLQIGEGSGVTMTGNYHLEGNPLPSASSIVCIAAGCSWLRIYLPRGTLTAGASYRVSVANVVDRVGLGIDPDPSQWQLVDAPLNGGAYPPPDRPQLLGVTAVGDTIAVAWSRAMLETGAGGLARGSGGGRRSEPTQRIRREDRGRERDEYVSRERKPQE